MNTFFCSDNSRTAGEDIIGSVGNHQTYVLIECPTPWAAEAFHSRWVPENLRTLVEEVKRAKLPIKFLLIANNLSHKSDSTTLLIYQQQEGLTYGFSKREYKLENIQQAAAVIKKYLWSRNSGGYELDTNSTRDILICTHGSHDKCCSRYGNPFHFHATNIVADLKLDNVRVWKSSHFGGHRFAPTCIDFPDGRYYGNLNQDLFKSIVTRTGDIQSLEKAYRGWGILPSSIQVVERELMLRYGWDWFNYKVVGRMIEQSADKKTIRAELIFEKPDGSQYNYQARLVKDETKTVELKSSCNAKQESVFVKYAVASLWLTSTKFVTVTA
ncbi:sucrase ferredoxin [Fischerella thermalis]|uniref:sucrase ferredoxin n=1 Tax=Fischerella thermalis TaxID=372787 RepID=UPI0019FD5C73|nr:sucrase ferredoxin [Fischerella thermalis]MBF2070512.1 sucrase ferredoxin [Fischerella thermalis M48_A2018_028]